MPNLLTFLGDYEMARRVLHFLLQSRVFYQSTCWTYTALCSIANGMRWYSVQLFLFLVKSLKVQVLDLSCLPPSISWGSVMSSNPHDAHKSASFFKCRKYNILTKIITRCERGNVTFVLSWYVRRLTDWYGNTVDDPPINTTGTLKVESFAGRNFRDFANFYGVRESLYPRNRTFIGLREILHEKSLKMASK